MNLVFVQNRKALSRLGTWVPRSGSWLCNHFHAGVLTLTTREGQGHVSPSVTAANPGRTQGAFVVFSGKSWGWNGKRIGGKGWES